MPNDPTISPEKRGRPRKVKPAPPIVPPTPPVLPDEREALRVEYLFDEIRNTCGKETEKRLRDLHYIWKNPIDEDGKTQRCRGDEIAELKKFGIVKTEITESRYLANGGAVAEYLREKFNYPCTRKDISAWLTGLRLPPGGKPFPMKDGAGRFKLAEVESWAKESLPMAGAGNGNHVAGKDARSRKEEFDARLIEIKVAEKERELDDKWMHKPDVITTVIAAVLKHHSIFKSPLLRLSDLVLQRLNPADFSEQHIMAIRSACNEAGTEIIRVAEDDCEKQGEAP